MQYDALSSGITLHCILLLWISKLICKLRAVRTPRKKICALIFKSQQIWSSNNNYKKRLLILRVPKAHINPCGLAIPLHTRFRKAGLLTAPPRHPSATLLLLHTETQAGPHSFWPGTASAISIFALERDYITLSISVYPDFSGFSFITSVQGKGHPARNAPWLRARNTRSNDTDFKLWLCRC